MKDNFTLKPRLDFGTFGGYPKVKEFIEEVKEYIDPIDVPILESLGLTKGLFDNKGKEFLFLNSSLFLPLSSNRYKRALKEGNLLILNKSSLVFDLPFLKAKEYKNLNFDYQSFLSEVEINPNLSLKDKVILGKTSDLDKETIDLINTKGGCFLTYQDIYKESLTESEISIEDIETFLYNQGAIINEDNPLSQGGTAVLKRFKRFQVSIRFDKDLGVWVWSETGKSSLFLRRYYSINSKPVTNPHLTFLLGLYYFLSATNERELKGRINLVPNLFSDRVNVGFSTPICQNFILNKLGLLELTIRLFPGSHNLIIIKRNGNLLKSIESYERLNYSTFVHKTGKYGVVEPECFTRLPEPQALVEYISHDRNEIVDSGVDLKELNTLLTTLTNNIQEEDVYRRVILQNLREPLSKVLILSKSKIDSDKWFTETSWQADKLSKLTGRALSHVPTGGYWKCTNDIQSVSINNNNVKHYLSELYS